MTISNEVTQFVREAMQKHGFRSCHVREYGPHISCSLHIDLESETHAHHRLVACVVIVVVFLVCTTVLAGLGIYASLEIAKADAAAQQNAEDP